MPGPTPRVFIIRHGETEWSLNGRHTGTSDIPLTPNGVKRIEATGRALVGNDRLIVPRKLAHIYVSPRSRAQRTLHLLMEESEEGKRLLHERGGMVETTEDAREWDYGDYEGVKSSEIKAQRKERGLPAWDIWSDGCPGGESPEDITVRLDRLIADIRTRFHGPAMEASADASPSAPRDVLIVAHGHVLRAFAARWVGRSVSVNPNFLLEAGGVGTLSYEHDSLDEPALLLGGSFVTDVVEEMEEEAAAAKAKAKAESEK